MAVDEITLVRLCGRCRAELGTITVRKENMMLCAAEPVWCPRCNAYRPELREVAGRLDSIRKEMGTYANNKPVGD